MTSLPSPLFMDEKVSHPGLTRLRPSCGRPEKPLRTGVGYLISLAATVAICAALLAPILRNW